MFGCTVQPCSFSPCFTWVPKATDPACCDTTHLPGLARNTLTVAGGEEPASASGLEPQPVGITTYNEVCAQIPA